MEKQALIRIVEELKEGSMTNSRMLGILNEVRKENGEPIKKNCPANKQRITELCRKVLGDNLTEETRYSGFGIGRQPTRFGLKNSDDAMKSIEMYFSAPKTKTPKGVSQKRIAVGKLLSILQKIDETPGKVIKKDTLKELMNAKSSVSMTLGSWKKMLLKDGIELEIKSSGGLYKIEKLDELKSKVTALYEKLMAGYEVKEKKTHKPAVIEKKIIEEDLTPEEEKLVFFLAKTCDHKQMSISRIWVEFKKQGLSVGFDLYGLIRRAGLKKWFVQGKKMEQHGMTSTLEFIGNLEVVASLLGQKVEKSILVRSSLEPNVMKSIVENYKLLSEQTGDNIYEVRFDPESNESRFNIFSLYQGFREGDGFIYDSDEELVLDIVNEMRSKCLK